MKKSDNFNKKINTTSLKETHTLTEIFGDSVSIAFIKSAMDAMPTPIIYKDRSGIIRYCNQAFADFNNLSKNDIIDKTLHDFLSKKISDIYEQIDENIMKQQIKDFQENEIIHIGDTPKNIMISRAAHVNEKGDTIGIITIFQDITELKTKEKREQVTYRVREIFWKINQNLIHYEDDFTFFKQILIELESVFEYLNHSTVMTCDHSNQLTVLSTNGYELEEISTFSIPLKESFCWHFVKDDPLHPHIINDVTDLIKSGHKNIVTTHTKNEVQSTLVVPIIINTDIKWYIFLDSNKNHIFNNIDLFAARFLQDEIPIFYRIFNLTRKTLRMSRYDELTQLVNRAYFETIFTDRMYHSKRLEEKLLLVVFDLDGLKRVNDFCGHHCGDLYISAFADFIRLHFRTSDAFARLGGDEFAGLMYNSDKEAISIKLKYLRNEFEVTQFELDGKYFNGSFSFGIVEYPTDSNIQTELMILADEKMYQDKKRKHNTFSRDT